MTHPSFTHGFSFMNQQRHMKRMQENHSLTDFEEAKTPEVTRPEVATPGEPDSGVAIPSNRRRK